MPRCRPFAAVVALALLIAAPAFCCAADSVALEAAREGITTSELKRHVEVLADDAFEGREAGSRGGRAAGGYLIDYLKRLGAQGAGDDGGFVQTFHGSSRNILAIVPGSDSELKGEVILLGAHYDHVGYGTSANSNGPIGMVHNGADDNASGTAAVAEVVQAFHDMAGAPRRSILFAFWDGEEKGLLGSKHWARNPTVPLDGIKLAINLDMVGRLRNDRLRVFGTRTARGMRQLLSRENRNTNLSCEFVWATQANSDHHPFYARNIPYVMLHTGLHDDYHRPRDDAHKINHDGMQRVSRLTFNLAYALTEADSLSAFRSASRAENDLTRKRLEKPLAPAPPRLGVRWERDEQPGLLLAEVRVDRPAWRGGLRTGDRLVQFAGRVIEGEDQFRADVLAASGPTDAVVRREGADEPLTLSIDIPGKPVRLGIAWRVDPAEPGAVLLTRVTPGSPAHRASLRLGDRIYEVDGRRFADSDEFLYLVTTHPGPLPLLAERRGRLRDVTLELPELATDSD